MALSSVPKHEALDTAKGRMYKTPRLNKGRGLQAFKKFIDVHKEVHKASLTKEQVKIKQGMQRALLKIAQKMLHESKNGVSQKELARYKHGLDTVLQSLRVSHSTKRKKIGTLAKKFIKEANNGITITEYNQYIKGLNSVLKGLPSKGKGKPQKKPDKKAETLRRKKAIDASKSAIRVYVRERNKRKKDYDLLLKRDKIRASKEYSTSTQKLEMSKVMNNYQATLKKAKKLYAKALKVKGREVQLVGMQGAKVEANAIALVRPGIEQYFNKTLPQMAAYARHQLYNGIAYQHTLILKELKKPTPNRAKINTYKKVIDKYLAIQKAYPPRGNITNRIKHDLGMLAALKGGLVPNTLTHTLVRLDPLKELNVHPAHAEKILLNMGVQKGLVKGIVGAITAPFVLVKEVAKHGVTVGVVKAAEKNPLLNSLLDSGKIVKEVGTVALLATGYIGLKHMGLNGSADAVADAIVSRKSVKLLRYAFNNPSQIALAIQQQWASKSDFEHGYETGVAVSNAIATGFIGRVLALSKLPLAQASKLKTKAAHTHLSKQIQANKIFRKGAEQAEKAINLYKDATRVISKAKGLSKALVISVQVVKGGTPTNVVTKVEKAVKALQKIQQQSLQYTTIEQVEEGQMNIDNYKQAIEQQLRKQSGRPQAA